MLKNTESVNVCFLLKKYVTEVATWSGGHCWAKKTSIKCAKNGWHTTVPVQNWSYRWERAEVFERTFSLLYNCSSLIS